MLEVSTWAMLRALSGGHEIDAVAATARHPVQMGLDPPDVRGVVVEEGKAPILSRGGAGAGGSLYCGHGSLSRRFGPGPGCVNIAGPIFIFTSLLYHESQHLNGEAYSGLGKLAGIVAGRYTHSLLLREPFSLRIPDRCTVTARVLPPPPCPPWGTFPRHTDGLAPLSILVYILCTPELPYLREYRRARE
jgi:hypothetical protein